MKASFLTDNYINQLSLLSKSVSSHSPIPILTSVLMEVKNGFIIFTTTDLEFSVNIRLIAKTEEEGGILVPGKQFLETLLLSRGKVDVETQNDTLVLSTTNGIYKFQALPKDEFPRILEEKGDKIAEFLPEEYGKIFSKILISISQDETRPHLTGVYIVKKENGVDYVTTDGYRMSLKRIKADKNVTTLDNGVIISPRLITEGLMLKSAEKITMSIYQKSNQAVLETEDTLLVGRLIEGVYPDYEKVLPLNFTTEIMLNKNELEEALRSTLIFARENANVIDLNISLGKVTIHSSSNSLGESTVVLEGKQIGDDNHIAFNIKFLLDFLKCAEGKEVVLKMNSPFDPALFLSKEDSEYFHVIMPVRLQD